MSSLITTILFRDELVGYLKALPKAQHFLSNTDGKAVALWQLLPQETPKNELLAGITRLFKVIAAHMSNKKHTMVASCSLILLQISTAERYAQLLLTIHIPVYLVQVPLRLWKCVLQLELFYEHQHEVFEERYGTYYYLSFIATRAECRGKGLGSLLLKSITDKADKEGR